MKKKMSQHNYVSVLLSGRKPSSGTASHKLIKATMGQTRCRVTLYTCRINTDVYKLGQTRSTRPRLGPSEPQWASEKGSRSVMHCCHMSEQVARKWRNIKGRAVGQERWRL